MRFVYALVLSMFTLLPGSSLGADMELDDVLTVEQASPLLLEYPFEKGRDINPDQSDFKIVHQILMSNKKGERWATVSLQNVSSGQRIFSVEQLLAVFANGDKREPGKIQLKLAGKETRTVTLYFGEHKFPILYVYTKNE